MKENNPKSKKELRNKLIKLNDYYFFKVKNVTISISLYKFILKIKIRIIKKIYIKKNLENQKLLKNSKGFPVFQICAQK